MGTRLAIQYRFIVVIVTGIIVTIIISVQSRRLQLSPRTGENPTAERAAVPRPDVTLRPAYTGRLARSSDKQNVSFRSVRFVMG